MKKNVEIRTEVLRLCKDEMEIRKVLIVVRENGVRSNHMDVRCMPHFGDWQKTSLSVNDNFVVQVQEWLKTGAVGPDLVEFELEKS